MRDTPKDFHKTLLGRRGEDAAVEYLKRSGYKIVDRNVTFFSGEIDIVARTGETYVFVEVKTRVDDRYGRPIEAVTPFKQNKYRQMAQMYIAKNKLEDFYIRFDVIEVLDGEITHTDNAF